MTTTQALNAVNSVIGELFDTPVDGKFYVYKAITFDDRTLVCFVTCDTEDGRHVTHSCKFDKCGPMFDGTYSAVKVVDIVNDGILKTIDELRDFLKKEQCVAATMNPGTAIAAG